MLKALRQSHQPHTSPSGMLDIVLLDIVLLDIVLLPISRFANQQEKSKMQAKI